MTAEEYRQKYYLSDKIDGHLEEFALIKCQEMQSDWEQNFAKNWIEHNGIPEYIKNSEDNLFVLTRNDHNENTKIYRPQIPPDLLTK